MSVPLCRNSTIERTFVGQRHLYAEPAETDDIWRSNPTGYDGSENTSLAGALGVVSVVALFSCAITSTLSALPPKSGQLQRNNRCLLRAKRRRRAPQAIFAPIGKAVGRPFRVPVNDLPLRLELSGPCRSAPTSLLDVEVGELPTLADNLAADQRKVRGDTAEGLLVRVEWVGRECG